MSAADPSSFLPSSVPAAVAAAPKTAHFHIDPSHISEFSLNGSSLRFPFFKIVLDTPEATHPVPEGYTVRTAEAIGVVEAVAINYVEIGREIAATNMLTHYWEHRALVTRSNKLWEQLVRKMSAWHAAHFDK